MAADKHVPLHESLADALSRRRRNGSLRSLRSNAIGTSALYDFSSNDYLDLSSSPALRILFNQFMQESSTLASTGSRLLSGNNTLAETIESEAKTFWGSPDALLSSSGYEANVSLFSTLPQSKDTIIYDELIHASVHVGMKNSRARKQLKLRHNDLSHLVQLLRQENDVNEGGNTFLAIETVYSMDGDLAALQEILRIIRQERPRTHLILDEAHATGIFGELGQGLAQHLGINDAPEILVRLHTLGKGAAGTGAIILCDVLVKQYLLNYAKGLIYSTYMSMPALCLARAAIKMLASGGSRSNMTRLWRNIHHLESLLRDMPYSTVLEIPESVASAIVPIITTRAVELSVHLQQEGFRVMPVRYPTVPRGRERLRICLRADISPEIISRLVSTIASWLEDKTEKVLQENAVSSAKL